MANPQHVQLVRQGAEAIAKWRMAYPHGQLDLVDADLADLDLSEADLSHADLRNARLDRAFLVGTYLANASLQGASLDGAILCVTDLTGADLENTSFQGAEIGPEVTIDESGRCLPTTNVQVRSHFPSSGSELDGAGGGFDFDPSD